MLEDREHQRDVLHNKLFVTNIDSIQNIERMLDEEKDAGAEDFLSCSGKYE